MKISKQLFVLILLVLGQSAFAQGTAFTYQGRLNQSGAPANGTYDFQFTVYDSLGGAGVVAGPVTMAPTSVASGVFTVTLEFGASVFTSAPRWMEVAVRTNGSITSYTTLTPRQPILPSPYAILSGNAVTAQSATNVQGLVSVVNGGTGLSTYSVGDILYASAPAVLQKLPAGAPGSVLKITNSPSSVPTWGNDNNSGGTVTAITAGTGLTGGTINISGTMAIDANVVPRLGATNIFSVGAQTIQTGADGNLGLVVKANSVSQSANLQEWQNNSGTALAAVSAAGAFVGNTFGTVANQAVELKANNIRAVRLEPNSSGAPNFIAGAPVNSIANNVIGSAIAGGGATNAFGVAYTNSISANFGFIGGGIANFIGNNATNSVIGGGYANTVRSNSYRSVVAGGGINDIFTNSHYSTIGGGYFHAVSVGSPYSTIGGGYFNYIGSVSPYGTIAGGQNNFIGDDSYYNTIGGGRTNIIAGNLSDGAVIAGGQINYIGTNSFNSFIGGGYGNVIYNNSPYAMIPGGYGCTAGGYSFAAGRQAVANWSGAFVWADNRGFNFSPTTTNQFVARCTGGAKFVSAINPSTGADSAGVNLAAGGGSWSSLSDRNAKENLSPIQPREILEKVSALKISSWNYKSQDEKTRHVGPMAQDFAAAFHVGEDNTHITTVDADGVALAAIQGLHEMVKEKDAEIAELKSRLEKLETLVRNALAH